MEATPIKVIVGLFNAISQKLPALQEWDSRKHHHALNSNWNICHALDEVREHVRLHGTFCLVFLDSWIWDGGLTCYCQTNTYENEMTRNSIAMTLIHSRASSCRSSSSEHLPASSITLACHFPQSLTSSTQRRRIPIQSWMPPFFGYGFSTWVPSKMPGVHPAILYLSIYAQYYYMHTSLFIIRMGTTLMMTAEKGF